MIIKICFFILVIISILIFLKSPRFGSLGTAFSGEEIHTTKMEKRIRLAILILSVIIYILLAVSFVLKIY